MKDQKKQQALDYHQGTRPGKIEIKSTKPTLTSRDLSLAYTPGVAEPCLEIAKNPSDVYKYTAKGNLVAVISNGTAVLGLGDIGPMASKPVMEGKGVLFKRFADIDVFDIEISQTNVEDVVKTIHALEPTFGGINLEDIKAPECFEIEKQLVELMNIPVFHDDQHGTAIIATAGFLNALEISNKKIEEVKIVFSGAGAASMACAKLFIDLGVKQNNLTMCDSKGVIYKGRAEGMNPYKSEFAIETKNRSLSDAMKNADAFMGLSARGVLSGEMVKTMAKNPIIFAMANPEPEIYPDEVAKVRSDAIMATGRSDFPNQVNNVLGFPFIFRGALDVRAKKINKEMKLAAVKALAELAKEEVPDEVRLAYDNQDFSFGKDYLIPKPFDKRVLTRVAPAVAKAAMDSGVAREEIKDLTEYAYMLEERLGNSASFMKSLRDRLYSHTSKRKRKLKVAFSEGSNARVLEAVSILKSENQIEPILLGDKSVILKKMKKLNLSHLNDLKIISPEQDENFDLLCEKFFTARQRKGVSQERAKELMKQENYYASMLAQENHVDSFIAGPKHSYPECFVPIMEVIGTDNNYRAAGVYILIFKNKILFLADCTANIDPSAESLSEIAISVAHFYKQMLKSDPRVAFLSFSNFGSSNHPKTKTIQKALSLTKEKMPDLICDGEIQADVAVNKNLIDKLFPFSDLDQSADILIFPDLNSANISYKLLTQLADVTPLGPVLVPMNRSVNIVQRTSSVSEIVNMSILTAIQTDFNKRGES
ncbi:NADP-dependent malic enzyme [bacterium]|nr:NADP-dependent malic enzyme [bacterium]